MTSAMCAHRLRTWFVVVLLMLPVVGAPRQTLAASAAGYEHYGASEGLASGEVVSIAEDLEGYLWVATLASGVHRFDGRVFERSSREKRARVKSW